jgi:hypothetical protein
MNLRASTEGERFAHEGTRDLEPTRRCTRGRVESVMPKLLGAIKHALPGTSMEWTTPKGFTNYCSHDMEDSKGRSRPTEASVGQGAGDNTEVLSHTVHPRQAPKLVGLRDLRSSMSLVVAAVVEAEEYSPQLHKSALR